jgi:hypothetical protein
MLQHGKGNLASKAMMDREPLSRAKISGRSTTWCCRRLQEGEEGFTVAFVCHLVDHFTSDQLWAPNRRRHGCPGVVFRFWQPRFVQQVPERATSLSRGSSTRFCSGAMGFSRTLRLVSCFGVISFNPLSQVTRSRVRIPSGPQSHFLILSYTPSAGGPLPGAKTKQ